MIRFLQIISLAMLASLTFADSGLQYEDGKVLVKFNPSYKVSGLISTRAIGATVESEIASIGWTVVRLAPNMNALQAMTYFRGLPSVSKVNLDILYQADFIPNDPGYSRQYGLKKIQCEPAWDIEKGSANVIVAVIDTGVDYNHPDLSGKCVPGKDFVNNDDDPMDDHGHGTHCAGNVGASTNNSLGVAGVAIQCKVLPVKVLNAGGGGSLSGVAQGITWAADNGAKILSLSLGHGGGPDQVEEDAVNYAFGKGCVVVCAAGNDSTTTPHYPAAYPVCIAVAATDANDQKAGFSTSGKDWCDIAAPGVNIYSTVPGGSYTEMSGTSMACPIAAGACAIVASRLGGKTALNTAIRARIEDNCDPVGSFISKGRVNLRKALPASSGGGSGVTIPPTSVTMVQGSASYGNLPNILASDNRFFVVTSTPIDRIGQVASTEVTFTSSLSNSQIGAMSVKMEAGAGTGVTCGVFGWNWTSNSYGYIGAVSLTSADAVRTLTVPADTITRYVSGTRQVKLMLRTLAPSTTVRSAMQFNFRNDVVSLQLSQK